MSAFETLDGTLPALRWRCGDVEALFTTRHGGAGTGAHASLNLAVTVGDDVDAVIENRRRVAALAGLAPGDVRGARQVHGSAVLEVSDADADTWRTSEEPMRDADALVAGTGSGLGLAVLVADCAPVVIVGHDRFAVVHAGWRGLVDGIVERAVEALGCDVLGAAVGATIGACCFEVGPEVAAQFGEAFLRPGGDGSRPHVDLAGAVAARLRACGGERVDVVDSCTRCDDRYFSYRGDGGTTGRQCVLARARA